MEVVENHAAGTGKILTYETRIPVRVSNDSAMPIIIRQCFVHIYNISFLMIQEEESKTNKKRGDGSRASVPIFRELKGMSLAPHTPYCQKRQLGKSPRV